MSDSLTHTITPAPTATATPIHTASESLGTSTSGSVSESVSASEELPLVPFRVARATAAAMMGSTYVTEWPVATVTAAAFVVGVPGAGYAFQLAAAASLFRRSAAYATTRQRVIAVGVAASEEGRNASYIQAATLSEARTSRSTFNGHPALVPVTFDLAAQMNVTSSSLDASDTPIEAPSVGRRRIAAESSVGSTTASRYSDRVDAEEPTHRALYGDPAEGIAGITAALLIFTALHATAVAVFAVCCVRRGRPVRWLKEETSAEAKRRLAAFVEGLAEGVRAEMKGDAAAPGPSPYEHTSAAKYRTNLASSAATRGPGVRPSAADEGAVVADEDTTGAVVALRRQTKVVLDSDDPLSPARLQSISPASLQRRATVRFLDSADVESDDGDQGDALQVRTGPALRRFSRKVSVFGDDRGDAASPVRRMSKFARPGARGAAGDAAMLSVSPDSASARAASVRSASGRRRSTGQALVLPCAVNIQPAEESRPAYSLNLSALERSDGAAPERLPGTTSLSQQAAPSPLRGDRARAKSVVFLSESNIPVLLDSGPLGAPAAPPGGLRLQPNDPGILSFTGEGPLVGDDETDGVLALDSLGPAAHRIWTDHVRPRLAAANADGVFGAVPPVSMLKLPGGRSLLDQSRQLEVSRSRMDMSRLEAPDALAASGERMSVSGADADGAAAVELLLNDVWFEVFVEQGFAQPDAVQAVEDEAAEAAAKQMVGKAAVWAAGRTEGGLPVLRGATGALRVVHRPLRVKWAGAFCLSAAYLRFPGIPLMLAAAAVPGLVFDGVRAFRRPHEEFPHMALGVIAVAIAAVPFVLAPVAVGSVAKAGDPTFCPYRPASLPAFLRALVPWGVWHDRLATPLAARMLAPLTTTFRSRRVGAVSTSLLLSGSGVLAAAAAWHATLSPTEVATNPTPVRIAGTVAAAVVGCFHLAARPSRRPTDDATIVVLAALAAAGIAVTPWSSGDNSWAMASFVVVICGVAVALVQLAFEALTDWPTAFAIEPLLSDTRSEHLRQAAEQVLPFLRRLDGEQFDDSMFAAGIGGNEQNPVDAAAGTSSADPVEQQPSMSGFNFADPADIRVDSDMASVVDHDDAVAASAPLAFTALADDFDVMDLDAAEGKVRGDMTDADDSVDLSVLEMQMGVAPNGRRGTVSLSNDLMPGSGDAPVAAAAVERSTEGLVASGSARPSVEHAPMDVSVIERAATPLDLSRLERGATPDALDLSRMEQVAAVRVSFQRQPSRERQTRPGARLPELAASQRDLALSTLGRSVNPALGRHATLPPRAPASRSENRRSRPMMSTVPEASFRDPVSPAAAFDLPDVDSLSTSGGTPDAITDATEERSVAEGYDEETVNPGVAIDDILADFDDAFAVE